MSAGTSTVQQCLSAGNPVVFFDVSLSSQPLGRIYLELFKDTHPKTAENFRQFCTGEHVRQGQPVGYKGCEFHRVIKGFMIQGGDFVNGDGTGRTSIYGSAFEDENLTAGKGHTEAGILSMANSGPNTNGCQFFITCGPAQWLDGKHIVFGRVVDQESLLVVRKVEAVGVGEGNRPRIPITVTQCGQM